MRLGTSGYDKGRRRFRVVVDAISVRWGMIRPEYTWTRKSAKIAFSE